MTNTAGRKPLGQLLLGRGFLQPAQLDRALEEQRRCSHQKLLGEILVELRQCSEEQVAEALAESYGLPFARVSPRIADPKVIAVLPKAFLEKHCVLPLFLVEGVLTVAVAEPADLFLREEIERVTGLSVQVVALVARDIVATVQTYMPEDGVFIIDDVAQEVDPDAFALLEPGDAARADGHRSPVGKLVNYCLYHAVKQGAATSTSSRRATRARSYRLDGRLVERMRPPLAMHEPMIARLKELAALDPARRVPQDGVIRARIDRRAVELAVSTIPAFGGEAVTIRVDREERGVLRLEKLGFGYDMLKQWRRARAAERPRARRRTGGLGEEHGSLFGAAGVERRRIEHLLGRDVGRRRARGRAATSDRPRRRHHRRDSHDPAAAAGRADGVGTDRPGQRPVSDRGRVGGARAGGAGGADAPSAVSRLLHMGAEPYAAGARRRGRAVAALVRRLCPGCKEPCEATASDHKLMEKWGMPLPTLHRSRGCPQCHNVGYAGRIGVHELLVPDDAITERLSQGAGLLELRDLAAGRHEEPPRDGMEKVKSGLTSLEEVFRVAG